jgi:hypothetical protein
VLTFPLDAKMFPKHFTEVRCRKISFALEVTSALLYGYNIYTWNCNFIGLSYSLFLKSDLRIYMLWLLNIISLLEIFMIGMDVWMTLQRTEKSFVWNCWFSNDL